MTDVIEPGTLVYGLTGAQAEYVAPHHESHFVRPLLVYPGNGYDEPDFTAPSYSIEVWSKVFLSPPTPIIEKTIQELNETIRQKREEIAALRSEHYGAEKEFKERLDRISKLPDLKNLDDFIAGKITHVVLDNYYGPEIVEFAKAFNTDDESRSVPRGRLKLLTLFGDPKNGLNWNLNNYSDGSGMNTRVDLFTSYEAAREKLIELLNVKFDSIVEAIERAMAASTASGNPPAPVGNPSTLLSMVRTSHLHDIPVPQKVNDVYFTMVDQAYEAAVKHSEESLKKAAQERNRAASLIAKPEKITV